VLPFVFVPFILSFPAGLIMYWITTNVWTIGQQQFLRRVIGKGQPPAWKVAEATAGNGAAAPGGARAMTDGRSSAPRDGAGNGASADDTARTTKAPPPPPRRKRKRSGRRR
jgi:YidC/Oxa1 family membrane protein insertase